MSDAAPARVPCPACGAELELELFTSVNAVLLPQLVDQIAAGRFERRPCTACGEPFQPEHPMLLSALPGGPWIVMRPWGELAEYPAREAEVEAVFRRELSGHRPRLVFGQAMLAEAVRIVRLGLEPASVECAKLLWVRRSLGRFLDYGPSLLCAEAPVPGGSLRCGVLALSDGRRLDAVELPAALLAEVRRNPERSRTLAPRLYDRPYVSAARYLYPPAT